MTSRYELKYEDFAPFFKVENGKLIRAVRSKRQEAGTEVGHKNYQGYLKFKHNGRFLNVHRVIFLLSYGYCPDFIDHINGDTSDNRIENLRTATNVENTRNAKLSARNKTGAKSVHKLKNGMGYQVYIGIDGKKKRFGTFKDFELAELVAIEARSKYHGAFANNGVRS